MTQELDKNGRPKIYCANCGKRMNYTYTQQWFGCSGYRYWSFWALKEEGRTFWRRAEAEAELQRLNDLGYRDRGYDSMRDEDLKLDSVNDYASSRRLYFVPYTEPVGEPVPFQFHSQECMMKFLQRSDIIRQILPIIEANRATPVIPVKKARKKPQRKVDLPDYNAMEKRILGLI